MANSRVGSRINARGFGIREKEVEAEGGCRMSRGRRKARVFPEPVGAQARRSRFCRKQN